MTGSVINDQAARGAVILAGGDSKRLGRPKAMLDFSGRLMIEVIVDLLKGYFQEITIVTDRPDLYRHLTVRISGDLLEGREKSPLRGIHAGLKSSELPYQFVVACDMPMLNLDLIRYMAGFAPDYDAVVPCIGSYFQPLHSFYSRGCIGIIEKQVKDGSYKITDFFDHLKIRLISSQEVLRFDPDQKSFININTWPDYEKALKKFSDQGN